MCGICLWIHVGADSSESVYETELRLVLKDANTLRGPDAQGALPLPTGFSFPGEFFASELRLRGDNPIVQPHVTNGNILCWNGEVFNGLAVSNDENDGVKLSSQLSTCSSAKDIQDTFASIEGPYAFMYYHEETKHIYFARDPLGRRSLLVHKPTPDQPYFLLSSVSNSVCDGFEEVSTAGIFSLELSKLEAQQKIKDCDKCLNMIPRSSSPEMNLPYAKISSVARSIPPVEWPIIEGLSTIPPHLSQHVDDLIRLLDESVRVRVCSIPQTQPEKARLAVLFSGGIDSAFIAALAHKHVPIGEPIDLFNVAFENPWKISTNARKTQADKPLLSSQLGTRVDCTYDVPDRLTGIEETEELRRLYPDRTWNFVEINVPFEESQKAKPLVTSLLLPGKTVMDMSLGLALYFASKGVGQIRTHPSDEPGLYISPAQVLLNGLGSDELLGGYSRYRSTFEAGGWQAVINELQMELDRLPSRNLGRDDRVISSNGKETRHPFLSLDLVNFLAQLPVQCKTDPRGETGVGEKMLLRLAAYKIGLVEASFRKKRAMQFGSRSARMEGERKGDMILDG